MPWPWVIALVDYWADYPPTHEVMRIQVEATTTWKPRGAEGLLDPEARASNNRFASATIPGSAGTKAFEDLPPMIQSAIMATRNGSKAVN